MRGQGGGRVGHAPGRKVVCVGRHGDKGMRMERVEGKGWGRGEIKVHTVRHTDKVPEGALSLAHTVLLGKAGPEGNMMSHKGEKLPEVPQVT